jgi:hypothetical protein
MWQQSGLGVLLDMSEPLANHERLEAYKIDEHESYARKKLTRKHRVLSGVTCTGFHHGAPVACRYAAG